MESFINHLNADLLGLYNNNVIESAVVLNSSLGRKFIAEKQQPMYFSGKFDAKTVFVMLNPGGASNDCYSFERREKYKYDDFATYLDKYMYEHINYGILDSCRMDNFDLKQAAFLYEFKNSDINIPNFFLEHKDESKLKFEAKENVLMNKLQLELIPFYSAEFNGVLDNSKQALENIDAFVPHIERILDAIMSYNRKYVIFGAKQFAYLFNAYKLKGYGDVEFGTEECYNIENLQKKVYVNTIKLIHKGTVINACIPYSFPRRDLPNAYFQMRNYGELCYKKLVKTFDIA